MSKYSGLYEQYGAVHLNRLLNPESNQQYDNAGVNVIAIVASKRLKLTRNNDNMAFLVLEDSTGSIDVMVFSRIYEELAAKIVVGEAVFASGRVSIREDEAPKLILERLETVEERISRGSASAPPSRASYAAAPGRQTAPPPPPPAASNPKAGLYLRIPSREAPVMQRVTCLLTIFDGATPVYLLPTDTGKLLRAPGSLWVDLNPVLARELAFLLGDGNVKIVT